MKVFSRFLMSVILCAFLFPSLSLGAGWITERNNILYTGEAVHDGPITLNGTVEVNGAIDMAGDIVDLNVTDSVTIGGKSTLNGELEVNDSDVDINLSGTTDEISIVQTNATGADGIPMTAMTDARTGTFADAPAEATLAITAAGAYGLAVLDGIVNIEGEIDCTGDMTLDPAGNDLIVDAIIDANSLTVDGGGAGVDAKTGAALAFGSTTATSTDIGKAGTMTTVKGTLNVDQAVTFDTTVGIVNTLTTSNLTVQTGGVIDIPDASIASADLAASLTDSTLFSNSTAKVYVQDLQATTSFTVPADAVSIDAINGITVTAAAINAAGNGSTATITPTLASNATMKVYAQELVATTTVTIPDNAIAVGKIGAGTLPDDVIGQSISNLDGYAYASNVNVTAGGAFVIDTGGSFTVPADAVSIDALNGITVTASAINNAGNGSTATLTPTLVSNATAKAYIADLEVLTTVSVPADSLEVGDIGAGSLPTDVIATSFSNATGYGYCSNFTVKVGGSVTLPSASIASAALPASIISSTLVSNATLEVVGATGSFSTSVYAPKVYITADDYFQEVGTTLVFVANSGAATNVLDADITTP